MRLYFDVGLQIFVAKPGYPAPLIKFGFKRGDAAKLEIRFYQGTVIQSLPESAELTFGLKQSFEEAAPFLAEAIGWEKVDATVPNPAGGDPLPDPYYKAAFSLKGSVLKTLIAAKPSIKLLGELTYVTTGDDDTSSQTLEITIANDVIKGMEDTPLLEPDPNGWLDERAIRHDKDMELDEAAQGRGRGNLGLGTSATLDWSEGGNGAADSGMVAAYDADGILKAYVMESEIVGVKKSDTIRGLIGSGLLSTTRTYALPETASFFNTFVVVDGVGVATVPSVYAAGQVRANTGGQVALMGGLPGQLGVYAGLWFGTTSPSDLNYTILSGAGSTIINGSSGLDLRIGNSTKGFLSSSGTFTLYGGLIATTGTFSGNVTAPAIVVDAVISTSSRTVLLLGSGTITTGHNGKRLIASGSSDVTMTQVSGLTAGHGYEIVNQMTPPARLLVAASGTTLNGSTRSIIVPHGATMEVAWTASNAYRTRMMAAESPRAGRRDATDPNGWEFYQDRYAEDFCNNSFVFTTGGQKTIPGPFGWILAAGDAYAGGGITMFTAAALNATSEFQSQIAGGTYDRASHVVSFDVQMNPVQLEVMLGWSDQFGTAGDYCAFGVQNATAGLPATFKFFRGLAGVQTVADSGIAYPTSMANYRLRVILAFDPVTAALIATVWKIPTASQFGSTPAPIYLGSARMGPSEAAPRNLTIQVYNDRPFMRLKTLDTTIRALSVNKTTLKGTTYY